jgi:hypothetical protein
MLARIITELVSGVVEGQLSSDDAFQLNDLGGSHGGNQGRHWVLHPFGESPPCSQARLKPV